jgi:hypothetical protein
MRGVVDLLIGELIRSGYHIKEHLKFSTQNPKSEQPLRKFSTFKLNLGNFLSQNKWIEYQYCESRLNRYFHLVGNSQLIQTMHF